MIIFVPSADRTGSIPMLLVTLIPIVPLFFCILYFGRQLPQWLNPLMRILFMVPDCLAYCLHCYLLKQNPLFLSFLWFWCEFFETVIKEFLMVILIHTSYKILYLTLTNPSESLYVGTVNGPVIKLSKISSLILTCYLCATPAVLKVQQVNLTLKY